MVFDRASCYEVCAKVARTNVLPKVPEDAPVRLFPIRYATLRDIEARMIMQFDVGSLDQSDLGGDLSSVWKMVTNPREYSWAIREIDPAWIAIANQILARNALHSQKVDDKHLSPPTSLYR